YHARERKMGRESQRGMALRLPPHFSAFALSKRGTFLPENLHRKARVTGRPAHAGVFSRPDRRATSSSTRLTSRTTAVRCGLSPNQSRQKETAIRLNPKAPAQASISFSVWAWKK